MLDLQKAQMTWLRIDDFSLKNHLLSAVDPRIHIIMTFLFVIAIVFSSSYHPKQLLLFVPYILLQTKLIGIPLGWLTGRLLLILPFIVFMGIFNPWLERSEQFNLFGHDFSIGWLSFISIILRGLLCVSLGILLISNCGIVGISQGLYQLKMPKIFCLMVYFIYNYFSLLSQEMLRIQKAYLLRKLSRKQRFALNDYREVLKIFFMRVWTRSNKIYQAMLCRGFHGELYRHHHYDRAASFSWLGLSFVYLMTCCYFY